ncbi:DUF4244 domain-containing protein [Dactylosporangium sp. CA-233914]|uniref:DUF4244 domain-containing protein n=1 Tax=Dactylosporangium sp. CA-233914 TaxID=3239934 RepID=UPI003D936876
MFAAKTRLLARMRRDDGSATVEYAFLVIVGVVIAGVLLAIVRSDEFRAYLTGLVMRTVP